MAIASFAPQPKRAVGTLRVADLARRAEVTPATVRYYARIGLLNPGRDTQNGYRRFTGDDLHRVGFIRKAQGVGLTIGDIRAILDAIERGLSTSDLVVELVRNRHDEIRRQLAALESTEARMANALAEWSAIARRADTSGELCPMIEVAGIEEGTVGLEERVKVRLRAAGAACRGSRQPAVAQA
jgi:DNA-binding transcriptional MerR regulator